MRDLISIRSIKTNLFILLVSFIGIARSVAFPVVDSAGPEASAGIPDVKYWYWAPNSDLDEDAENFLQQTGLIADTFWTRKINTLVVDLKDSLLWDSHKSRGLPIWPFAGSTAATQKYNLMDPRDANDAFRLTFFGGWTFKDSGAYGNGTNTYAATYFVPGIHLLPDTGNVSLTMYSRTNYAEGWDMGARVETSASSYSFGLIVKFGDNRKIFYAYGGTNASAVTDSAISSVGYQIGTRRSGAATSTGRQIATWWNGTIHSLVSNPNLVTRPPKTQMLIGAVNLHSTQPADPYTIIKYPGSESRKGYAFASVGPSYTDNEARMMTNIINRYISRP